MDESTNAEGFSDVDGRPTAGITRSPLDETKAIQTLLADVYKDAGDGRTLFRELVQNADDAGARRLKLTVLEQRGQAGRRAGEGGSVTGREMAAGRIPERRARRREFRAHAPAGAADAFGGSVPPFAPAPWWGTRLSGAALRADAVSASAASC